MSVANLRIATTQQYWPLGTRVRKLSGSEWEGEVVGYYSTKLNQHGVCVESSTHRGSVQIYPIRALEKIE